MNVLSSVAAGIALILFTVDIIFHTESVVLPRCHHYGYDGYNCNFFGQNMVCIPLLTDTLTTY